MKIQLLQNRDSWAVRHADGHIETFSSQYSDGRADAEKEFYLQKLIEGQTKDADTDLYSKRLRIVFYPHDLAGFQKRSLFFFWIPVDISSVWYSGKWDGGHVVYSHKHARELADRVALLIKDSQESEVVA